jgi:hypothetical protein
MPELRRRRRCNRRRLRPNKLSLRRSNRRLRGNRLSLAAPQASRDKALLKKKRKDPE